MGWSYSHIIRGSSYTTGTQFVLNGNVPCYGSCDDTTPDYWKNSVTAWYYGRFDAAYSKHPYCISTTRPGKPDLFVDESAFPPVVYYVYYNLNGGSGDFPTQSKQHGGSVRLYWYHPSRTGYTFKGWSTSSAATSPDYYAESVYSGNASITLYAVWQINTYTVTYNANGGTCTPTSRTFNYNALLTLPTPTRVGYTFTGWKLNSTAGAALSTSTRVTSSFTAVATWAINTYRFTVYANGGTLSTGSNVFNAIANYGATVSVPNATRTGYTFAGWSVTGKGTLSRSGSGYQFRMDTSNVQLTAQWTVNEYSVTFDANTNGGTPSKIIGYDYGEYVRTDGGAFYTPTKPYCEFVGWYYTPYETDSAPINLNTMRVTGDVTIYAHFEEKNTMLVSAEGSNRPAMAAVYARNKYIEECEVMIYVDGAWRKAVVQT